MNDIIKAWTEPGPVPEHHRAMQDKLRREWRALAVALDRASESYWAERRAEAWDQGYRAANEEWNDTFDLVTPDEDRYVAKNPYRAAA